MSDSSQTAQSHLTNTRALSKLSLVTPFFLGAALYLSVIFAVFSPLPQIYTHLRLGRFWGIVCSITNLALVFLISGRVNAAVFFVIAVVLSASIAESLKLKIKIELNAIYALLAMLAVSGVLLSSYSYKLKQNPFVKIEAFVGSMVEQVASNVEKYKDSSTITNQELDKFLIDPEMTKKNILYELPSAITIGFLIVIVANLLLALRLNLRGIRDSLGIKEDFFKSWKTPDHLVWPTLVAGFCLVIEVSVVSDIALNIFKILMACYALQGLAITNYLFDLWGVKGLLRTIGYVVVVAILLPLVISLGFFDLWFDFRKKVKV